MITVGMIKKALENIPDDVSINFNGENISSTILMNISYEEISKNVLKIKLCNYTRLIIDVCVFYKCINENFSLTSLIHVIKNNDMRLPCESFQYISNIDTNIKKLLIYKIYDNYQYINEKLLNFFNIEKGSEQELKVLNDLEKALKKILL